MAYYRRFRQLGIKDRMPLEDYIEKAFGPLADLAAGGSLRNGNRSPYRYVSDDLILIGQDSGAA